MQIMAAAQHPIDPAALSESFSGAPTWRSLPSWALIAMADRSIPTELLRFMAQRAGSTAVEVESSHALPVVHPVQTAELIDAAAQATSSEPQVQSA
jgi:pimeloyl-ACP methyl ester carboxylesterase